MLTNNKEIHPVTVLLAGFLLIGIVVLIIAFALDSKWVSEPVPEEAGTTISDLAEVVDSGAIEPMDLTGLVPAVAMVENDLIGTGIPVVVLIPRTEFGGLVATFGNRLIIHPSAKDVLFIADDQAKLNEVEREFVKIVATEYQENLDEIKARTVEIEEETRVRQEHTAELKALLKKWKGRE